MSRSESDDRDPVAGLMIIQPIAFMLQSDNELRSMRLAISRTYRSCVELFRFVGFRDMRNQRGQRSG